MKFFTTSQIRQLDQYTIEHEPITSIDLMERAANAIYREFIDHFRNFQPINLLAGPGNNGGDALALARMLLQSGYSVSVSLFHTGSLSADCEINKKRLLEMFPGALIEFDREFVGTNITEDTIIIDGLFGSGLNRPLTGIYAQAVEWINSSCCKVVAIDIPTGLHGEENSVNETSTIVNADLTFSIQFPKLAFLLPENAKYVGNWNTINIGIHPKAIEITDSNFYYLDKNDIAEILKERQRFSHKGTFGHAYITAGSMDMAGAAILSAKAALRSGAGLVTIHSAAVNRPIVQSAVPEAIFQSDKAENFICELRHSDRFNAIAIGLGIGTNTETVEMLHHFLKSYKQPCILDADALNIISQNKDFLTLIPKNSILTPHPKEFERIFGTCSLGYDRMKKASEFARKLAVIIILKGAHTLIATPNGKLFFNSTGNAGMATAGSGDVLTGMLAGLLAQGYTPEETAKIGVYIHGLSGDLSLKKQSIESLIATDIIENIGQAFISIRTQKG